MEYVLGWRWLYAYWPGPLVDEVERLALRALANTCALTNSVTRQASDKPPPWSLQFWDGESHAGI